MGVIYKLKPEIANFILEAKKADPKISCRSMVALIENKFQTKISKSSVNALFKQSGLSMSVGRRRTKRKYTLKIKGVIAAQTRELAVLPEQVTENTEAPKPAPDAKGCVGAPPSAGMPAPPEEVKAEEEARIKAEAEAKAREEAELKARQEADERALQEAKEREKSLAEEIARRVAEEKARLAAELKAQLEAELKAKEEAEVKAKAEEEVRLKAEAETNAREEAELKANAEAEEKARIEAEEKARKAAEEKARVESAEKARKEAEEKARQEAELKVKEEAEKEDIKIKLSKVEASQIVQTEGSFDNAGVAFLKAADYLLGGSTFISDVIKSRLKEEKSPLAKIQPLIYASLFRGASSCPALWPLLNCQFSDQEMASYLAKMQEIAPLPLDTLRTIASICQEVRSIQIGLSDGSSLYLDGQLHTLWSTMYIPCDFATTIYNIKSYIKKHFQEDAPLILFMAPGYDSPTREFFDFLAGLEAEEKRFLRLSLYGNRFEEIEAIRLDKTNKRQIIFGLWPWQFKTQRLVKILGEFSPFHCSAMDQEFYLANTEIELIQPAVNKRVTLTGCAIKTNLSENTKVLVLTNLRDGKLNLEDLANAYLERWPNLEEGFQDYSRKIELFTYTASAQQFFSTENLDLPKELAFSMQSVFAYYLGVLDLYVRWRFLPVGYEKIDFSSLKERFYSLPATLAKQKNSLKITFKPPSGYPFLKDLIYACHRVNEQEIYLENGQRLRLWV